MSKTLFLIIAFTFSIANLAAQQNEDYASYWSRVADFEQRSLPRSAAEEINNILRQAIADKNSPQVIKALIHQAKYDLVIDTQNDSIIFRNLYDMLAKSSDVVERSVLHSMLGELYLQYYQRDRWNIDRRTALSDFVPEDMKEWTRNIFFDKVVEHLNASLQSQAELIKTEVAAFEAVIELHRDSRRFSPTMYDFLARRAIQFFAEISTDEDLSRTLAARNISTKSLFAPAKEFVTLAFNPQPTEYNLWLWEAYRQYLSSLLSREMDKSVVLVELEKLSRLRWQQPNEYERSARPLLDTMLKQWENRAFSVEIIDRIADFYQDEIRQISDQNIQRGKIRGYYEYLQEIIHRFPDYERIGLIENRILQLTQSELSISGNATFPINGKQELTITYKNVDSLNARLYRKNSLFSREQSDDYTFVKNISIPLSQAPKYWQSDTTFSLNINEYGAYRLSFETLPEMTSVWVGENEWERRRDYFFVVSDLTVFSRLSAENVYDYFVVNRVTGEPINNAQVNIYRTQRDWWENNVDTLLVASNTTNEIGLVQMNITPDTRNFNYFYHAVTGNDSSSRFEHLSFGNFHRENFPGDYREIQLFTDRSIYRPGQIVYFKAVLTDALNEKSILVPNRPIEFSLIDANGQEISEQTLTTNEFGSASGEFVLPHNLLSGYFSIDTYYGEINFRVEEYKRPTFEITFDKIEETYRFGEEIVLRGKAETFSGIQLQNAEIDYRIMRQQAWWGRWGSSPEHFAQETITTDENGNFEIRFTPEKPDAGRFARSIYTFAVEVVITSASGETQTGNYSITVGDISMILNVDIPNRWEKSSDAKITIFARNLDGNDISAQGTWQIFSLHENDSINRRVARGNFATGEQSDLKNRLRRLASGKYRIQLQSTDDRGNDIEAEQDFILFSFSDARPPIKTNEWFVQKSTIFGENRNAEIIFGASEKVHVLYELWRGDTLLEREWITLNNENRLFSFSQKPEYKNGVTLMLRYIKDEQFYSHSVNLVQEREVRGLNVRLDVFRDKIRPGTEEEWRISVRDKDGNPALAEVLASMYDMSLDNIFRYDAWHFSLPSFGYQTSQRGLQRDNSFNSQWIRGNFNNPSRGARSFEFDRFYWFNFSFSRGGRMWFSSRTGTPPPVVEAEDAEMLDEVVVTAYGVQRSVAVAGSVTSVAAPNMVAMEMNDEALEEMVVMAYSAASVAVEENVSSETASAPQIRRNFSETAFFYPQLRTNSNGETQIAFTVPESNTRWRFRVLAHDKNLNIGQTEAITVSQKELMVTLNMPRFLRQGDRASIATKISNLSDEMISGNVRIEFINPVTEEMINSISVENQVQSFSLAQNASSDAAWTFDVPTDIDLIGVRIIAESELFSDGEQHALVVLPNRMMVTESMRMDVNGNQTKSFEMGRLTGNASPTAENYRLTLEFSSNPAWYAVQALPVLSTPTNESATAWFASYYTNTIGAHIGKAYPKVRAMIDAWQAQGGTSETLLSNLEENQELKAVLLEETPWVLDAKNESEQKQKLALLFDINRSQNLTNTAIQKLQELQTAEGGWSWFNGFRPSVSITHYILYGFSQLQELEVTTFSSDIRRMKSNAVRYIDRMAVERFESLKRYNPDWRNIRTISTFDLEYLYVRSAYSEIELSENVKEMIDFYTSVITRNWTLYDLYHRSLIAILMQRSGNQRVMNDILRSFREHATVSDELGMFWANNRAHVFMSQSAVSVHTFIMKAFRLGGATSAEMDNMKRWLLKQKQTQIWESTHATLDAVYTLLSIGTDWFSTEGTTTITLGGQTVEPSKTELGTGYFKESWIRSEIRPEMGNVQVVHSGNAPAWGALYLQYFEELDKIEGVNASLDVEKLLFVEQIDASGRRLLSITENNPLTVGDKVIVRLTVRADRDFEFVHLRDMRAAAFEPVEQISGMRWQNNVRFYQTSRDASTNFYFDVLPRGTYVFEYSVFVNRTGSYSNGITTIQCMYAPEFTSHTSGIRINVK
ncbi:MAG: hypothetical protein LBI15_06545 [Dysgonamonadaceae bacterium]|jgi:uncharacterized protein YfaS (alpha-2-macroglobulin family)|nr:hypothetical protein [Dysgonamonadaceae bacterium]